MTRKIEPGFHDLRYRFLVEAEAAEELMSADDREFLGRYVPRSVEAQAEHEALRRLANLGNDDELDAAPNSADDDELVQAVVDLHIATAGPAANDEPLAAVSGARRLRRRRIGAMLAAAALTAITTTTLVQTTRHPEGSVAVPLALDRVAAWERVPVPTFPWPTTASAVPDLQVLSGQLAHAGSGTPVAEPLIPGTRVVAASEETCIGTPAAPGNRLCLERGAAIELTPVDDGVAVTVAEGVAHATFTPTPHGIRTYHVMVAGDLYGPVMQSDVVTLVIDVRTPQRWEVVVEGGVVRVRDPRGGVETLVAGDTRALGIRREPGRAEAPPEALLAQARGKRARGDRRGAIATYETLVQRYASTPIAKPAMISLGQLYLEAGRARKALRWFDQYVARGTGPLDEEALYGRIRAFERLGRFPEEASAIQAFLAKYPSSSYAPGLRRRLP